MVLMRKTPFRCMDLMNNDSSDEDSEVSVTEEMLSIFLACQAEMKTLDQGKSFWCRANLPRAGRWLAGGQWADICSIILVSKASLYCIYNLFVDAVLDCDDLAVKFSV